MFAWVSVCVCVCVCVCIAGIVLKMLAHFHELEENSFSQQKARFKARKAEEINT